MKKFMILRVILMGIVGGMISVASAYAHYLWINVDDYSPKVGQEITISLGWGHRFPVDEQISADRAEKILEKMYIISPDGKEIPLEIEIKGEGEKRFVAPIKVKLEKSGIYLIVAERKSGFVTKTTERVKFQSKKELKGIGILDSKWVEGSAKAIVNVGKASGDSFQKEIGQRFQVIPLDNPAELKKGDYLRVKVTLDGEPYRSWVYATYAGFSSDADTFAYTAKPDKKEKIAKIKILKRGVWLIKSTEKLPYPDREEADVYSFTSTLTFEIK